ncbi:MAG: group 1 truncated hemoglobin [Marinobacter sp.]|nr:group 1 truncated hemoglobin [Marinobacter sp.]
MTRYLVTLLAIALLMGCQTRATEPADALYQALGERPGIEAIVEDLLFRIVDDDRIAFQFRGIDAQQFIVGLSDQICELSGGPCQYTGKDMVTVHRGMAISDSQFNAVAEHLVLAMERHRVGTGAQNRLLALLVPMYPEIVRQ